VLNGPINAEAFKTYVRAELIKIIEPNDIVILDNLNSHKGKAVRAMVKAIGARLFFLPPYSPDLNPNEQAFTKIKHVMRKAMGRSVEAVGNAVAEALGAITSGMLELPCKCQIQVNLNATRSKKGSGANCLKEEN
jgi:transposase